MACAINTVINELSTCIKNASNGKQKERQTLHYKSTAHELERLIYAVVAFSYSN